MGVYAAAKVTLVAETMARLGVRHAFVVHGLDGLDELTLTGESSVAEVIGAEGNRKHRDGSFGSRPKRLDCECASCSGTGGS